MTLLPGTTYWTSSKETPMTNQRNVVYAYSWSLPSGDLADVERIMESIREFCIELGCEEVSDLLVDPDSVGFTAVVPEAGGHEFFLRHSLEDTSWKRTDWLRCASFKEVSEIMYEAAKYGIDVRTTFAGMEMLYRLNALGVIEVEQRPAFDPDTF